MAEELRFLSKIPMSVKEEVGEITELNIQVNIGIAYLNRGYFERAIKLYEKVLSVDGCRKTAKKGVVYSVLSPWIIQHHNCFFFLRMQI